MLRSITNLPRLPARPRDAHKGTFGKVLIIAGSVGMSGAAILTGLGALRGGAGLVHIATPSAAQPVVAAGHPCYLTTPLPSDADGGLAADAVGRLEALLESVKVIAFGPGLGRSAAIANILELLLTRHAGPMVVDADGMFALGSLLQKGPLPARTVPIICTPHPGEFAQLTGLTTQQVQADRKAQAVRFATEHHVIVALKGHGTIVTDGQRVFMNTTGNPGMAKGGSGDVLTGLIAALLAQGLAPLEATQLGVYLHGLAGDIASGLVGEQAMLPTDLVEALSMAFRKHSGQGG
jgi:ADP-dependent NAD(P)H-hydrate dehydratase